MFSLVSLIMLFFGILATILIMVMAAILMIALMVIFFIVAIIVGMKQQSIFKGLRVFILACSVLITTPLVFVIFGTYSSQLIKLSLVQTQWAGVILGVILGIAFGILSYTTFEKMAKYIYHKLSKKEVQQ